ncbi:MAG TPA: sugar transferase [Bryobacteraceae bacterium]|jgi:exopolysaccharide biosynthesis polyprenyl glycosylphosphotransferase|nr:sugar transferase [Bryobacteraceae bacterium]
MIQIFRVFIPASILGLIVSEFLLIFLCYVGGALLLTPLINADFSLSIFFQHEGGAYRIAFVVLCIVAGVYFQNLYSMFRVRSLTLLVQQLCVAIGATFLIQSILTYLKHPEWGIPKYAMIFGSLFTLVVIPAWRVVYSGVIVKALGTNRVLFLGTSDVSQDIARHIKEHPELGMRNLGYIDNHGGIGDFSGGKLLGNISEFPEIAKSTRPDLIVVGLTERRQELPVNAMLHLRFSGIHFEEAPVTFETTFGRVLTKELRPSRLIFSTELGPRRRSLFWHSLYSFPIAVAMTVVLAPVMVIVAILVKASSKGPVLHRQVRVGLNDAHFTLYKFRSMFVDAEAATGPVWAAKNDPRVTPVGKWLRRLRLDELPQLFNVLKGEMTLVGPRPERPEFVAKLTEQIPYYSYRHCVKPGITGWAQINHKYGDTLEDAIIKLEYDLYYIKNLAISLDTFIIFHTLKVMLFSETAQ